MVQCQAIKIRTMKRCDKPAIAVYTNASHVYAGMVTYGHRKALCGTHLVHTLGPQWRDHPNIEILSVPGRSPGV
jgi:hypothetical protein